MVFTFAMSLLCSDEHDCIAAAHKLFEGMTSQLALHESGTNAVVLSLLMQSCQFGECQVLSRLQNLRPSLAPIKAPLECVVEAATLSATLMDT